MGFVKNKAAGTSLQFCLVPRWQSEIVSASSYRWQSLVSDMQIFLGACLFFVAVAMLAYVPGKLLLILLKRTLSSVEDFTLACVLGLVVSALAYWLMALTHQAHVYVLWPLATTGFFLSPRRQVEIRVRSVREGHTARRRNRETVARQIWPGLSRGCRARCHHARHPAATLHQSDATGRRHHAGPSDS